MKVRIGSGSLHEMQIWTDEDWPVVPHAGEEIMYMDEQGGTTAHTVKSVGYMVSPDHKLIGALVLV